jgi:hypothetical protein
MSEITTSHDSGPCPCGKGAIHVAITSPDHMYAKPRHTKYDASLACGACSQIYQVENAFSGKPRLVRKADIAAKEAATAAWEAANAHFAATDLARRLIPSLVQDIDSQKTKIAKYRTITKYGLHAGTLEKYRKNPFDGAKAVERADGYVLAQAGALLGLGGADTPEYRSAWLHLKALRDAFHAATVPAVKTGIDAMAL